MPVMPWKVNSTRILFGRAVSMTMGASMPGPIIILPLIRMLWTAFSFARPPLASMFLAMISSAVWAQAAEPIRPARNRQAKVLRFMDVLLWTCFFTGCLPIERHARIPYPNPPALHGSSSIRRSQPKVAGTPRFALAERSGRGLPLPRSGGGPGRGSYRGGDEALFFGHTRAG